ncbi:hypothetical protein FB451DRAFT_1406089 [Mycena latifolia]|nr:hypothetical protein FB451DRAFT_1406089 [Mycena latifolia]
MALLTAAPFVTLVPTATSDVPSVNTTSHSRRPDPTQHFKSERQAKAPVGVIVGGAIAVLAGICGLFFLRWLFLHRARRRKAAHAVGALPISNKRSFSVAQIPVGGCHIPEECGGARSRSRVPSQAGVGVIKFLALPQCHLGIEGRGLWITDFSFGFIHIIKDSGLRLRRHAADCRNLVKTLV